MEGPGISEARDERAAHRAEYRARFGRDRKGGKKNAARKMRRHGRQRTVLNARIRVRASKERRNNCR